MKKQVLDDMKLLIRTAEGITEVLVLGLIFNTVWQMCYFKSEFPLLYVGEKLNLLFAVYIMLTVTVFALCDCFHYGHAKFADMLVSQWVSVFIVNCI